MPTDQFQTHFTILNIKAKIRHLLKKDADKLRHPFDYQGLYENIACEMKNESYCAIPPKSDD